MWSLLMVVVSERVKYGERHNLSVIFLPVWSLTVPEASEGVRYRRHCHLPVLLIPVVSPGPCGLLRPLWSLTQ